METDFSHTLAGGKAGLGALLDAVEMQLAQLGVPPGAVGPVMIAADEILSNVLEHGGARAVEIAVKARAGRVTVEIVDDGKAFDPMAAAAPDTGQDLEDRQIGGLGIHLVRKLMDDVAYERRDEQNRLRFSKSYPPTSPSRQAESGSS
jgi:serine/threonine-protein kinase RsbW